MSGVLARALRGRRHLCAAAVLAAALLVGACPAPPGGEPDGSHLVITELMVDPRAVADEHGEWIEVHNPGTSALELRGWTLASRNDAPHRIAAPVTLPAGGYAVLARSADTAANGGVRVAYAYGSALSLGNSGDWVALRDAAGVTIDSVAWEGTLGSGASRALTDPAAENADARGAAWQPSIAGFGAGDRGTPGAPNRTPGTLAPPDPLAFGRPTDADERDEVLLRRPEFVLSYSPQRGGPNWVAWHLRRADFGDAPRCNCFAADTALPRGVYRVVSSDYSGSGYDRGHLVRSEERTAGAAANAATFLMTNVLPQTHDLNAGPWLRLEEHLQEQVQREGYEVFLLAGGYGEQGTLKDAGRVVIPTRTWKIALLLRPGQTPAGIRSASELRLVAVDMPNTTGIADRPWQEFRTSVDALEAATGYDFLHALPDALEAEVERDG